MIHFFKKKPFLRDLIPDNYIDIHSHLLPGIDDGATTIEDTSYLIDGLQEIGFKKFITTPHVMSGVWNNTKNQIEKVMKKTIHNLSIENNTLKVAAEYMIDAEFRELLKEKNLLTLQDNFVLVEISYLNPPIQLYDILFELQVAGYSPILAHPERYNFYHHSIEEYKKLKNAGCSFQLNMLSTTGYYGERVAKTADILLKNGLIDFIGSDIHHTRHLEQMQKRIVLKNQDFLSPIFQNNSFFDF